MVNTKNNGSMNPIAMEKYANYGPRFKLPLLYINGVQHYSTKDICRFLGKSCKVENLMGDTARENLHMDMLADNLDDMRIEINKWNYLEDIYERKENDYRILGELIPSHLSHYEQLAKQNDGFLIRKGKPTWVDFYFAGILDYLRGPYHLHDNYLDKYPYLSRLVHNIHCLPRVCDWVLTRPTPNWDWQYMFFYKIG